MRNYRLVILLVCCLLQGARPLPAQLIHHRDSLLAVARSAVPDTAKVWAEMEAGKLYLNYRADSAAIFLSQALQRAESIGFERGMAKCRINKAVALYDLGQYDSLLALCNAALPICEKRNMGKEQVATYNLMANTWNSKGNAWLAIRYFEKCLEIMKTTPVPAQFPIVVNSNLANTCNSLHLYDKAVKYATNSLQLAEETGDELTVAISCQYLANAWDETGHEEKALEYYQRALAMARKLENNRLIATTLSNIAESYADRGDYPRAEALYREGLQVARTDDDQEGMVYNLHGLSLVKLAQRQFAASERYSQDALQISQAMKLDAYTYAIYLTLSDVALAQGSLDDFYQYRNSYHHMRDTIASKAEIHALQELETKYETEKKEQQIQDLRKEQELQEMHLRQKNWFLAGLALLALLVLALAVIGRLNYNNRKKILHQELKLQQQKIRELEQERQLTVANAIMQGQEKERSRLARDLHDGLGGMLSGIKQALFTMKGNQILPEKSALSLTSVIDDLDRSIGELRHIARNMMPEALLRFGLKDALEDYCDHLRQSAAIEIRFQAFGMDQRLPNDVEIVVFRIAQELLNNAVRHAAAKKVLLQLLHDDKRFSLTVEDDGKGFNPENLDAVQGVGWMNIQSRVHFLNGRLDLRSAPGEGCSVNIEFETT